MIITFRASVMALKYKWKKANALMDLMGHIKCFYPHIYILVASSLSFYFALAIVYTKMVTHSCRAGAVVKAFLERGINTL